MIVASASNPLPNLRRIRRDLEAHRLEQIKKAHADVKRIAQEEVKFFKDLFPKDDTDDNDEIKNNK